MRGDGRGSVERLPSGSWRATWYPPEGGRTRRTFADEDDATLWLAERRIEVKRGVWAPPKPTCPTVAEYAAHWIVERRNRAGAPLRPRTRADYEATLRLYITPTLGSLPLDKVTPARVRSWYASLDGRPSAQAKGYVLLGAVMRQAVDDDLIPRSPCRIRGGGSTGRVSEPVVLSPAEVRALASAMPAHLSAAVSLSAFAALRFGELAALRRRDVAPDGSSVRVERAASWTRGHVHIGPPKSAAGVRTVAIPPALWSEVVEHLRVWTGPDPDGLVFTSGAGHMLRHSTLYYAFREARRTIGRPSLRWHDLRHTGATMAAQAGATLKELQARIGHSTVTAAMRYQHATSERDRELAARLSVLAEQPAQLRVVPHG